jgi:hypothetical protein
LSQRDIKIPADASDQQTTDARSALPPVEFTISAGPPTLFTIQDRQGPQDRVSTSAYRVYFLPDAFAPASTGTTVTVPDPVVFSTAVRYSGRKAASLVAEVQAPSLGTVLSGIDTVNLTGQGGFYYCVGVNRNGVEAPVEHIVHLEQPAAPLPPVTWLYLETTYGGAPTITGTIDGVNVTFTMTQGFGTLDAVWVDGIIDIGATAADLVLTTSTPPISSVTVVHFS